MNKKVLLLSIIVMSFISNNVNAQLKTIDGKKALVVWYSHSGNTTAIAKHIQSATGADLFEIIPETEYPTEYNTVVEQAKKEINDGYRPPLKEKKQNISDYDLIFVGTPNWWSTIAPPVATFLTEHNLSGKTIIPFVTHGGGGKARCFSDMEKIVTQATFLNGFVISGTRVNSAQNEVTKWLREVKVID